MKLESRYKFASLVFAAMKFHQHSSVFTSTHPHPDSASTHAVLTTEWRSQGRQLYEQRESCRDAVDTSIRRHDASPGIVQSYRDFNAGWMIDMSCIGIATANSRTCATSIPFPLKPLIFCNLFCDNISVGVGTFPS